MMRQSLWCCAWRALRPLISVDESTTVVVGGTREGEYSYILVKRPRFNIVLRPWNCEAP